MDRQEPPTSSAAEDSRSPRLGVRCVWIHYGLETFKKRLRALAAMLRSIGFGIPVLPDGAFYIFADASKWTDDSYDFAFELLEKAGVAVTPGVDFGEAGRRSIRFTYANSEENIREAARRLGEYLGKR